MQQPYFKWGVATGARGNSIGASSGLGKNSGAPQKSSTGEGPSAQGPGAAKELATPGRAWPRQEAEAGVWAPGSSHGSPKLGQELGCVTSRSCVPGGRQGCRAGVHFPVTLGKVVYQLLGTL